MRLSLASVPLLTGAVLLAGCSMSAEWWIRHSLREAGFSRAEAACATRGARDNLSSDQMWELRSHLSDPDRPDLSEGVDALLSWSATRFDPDIQRVFAHFAAHCRRGRAGSGTAPL